MRLSNLQLPIALAGFLLLSAGRACAQQETAPPRNAAAAAFAPIEDDPALPRALMIGDSISVGYTLAVREALAGKANVHRPAANCGNTTKGLQYLSQWLGDGHWDVIHFNWGLHDLTSIDDKPEVPINEYEKNLRELVTRLKKTGATLIWCSTTPVPPGRRAPLKPEDVLRYNEVARKIMDENGIAIDDLYAFALPRLKEIQQPTNVHVTPEGSKVLAQQVAASIEAALQQRPAEKSSAPTAYQASAAPKPLTDMTAKERSQGEDGGVQGGQRSTPPEERLQQMLRRFPEADLNKDGKLTLDEFREFRRKTQTGSAARSSLPADAATNAPTAAAANAPLAGPVEVQITSDKPAPVNPRVYGIICEEMFVKDLVDEPEYIAALTELKFKTFNYPGGSISYYHHPRGTGGFNIRPEEVRKSKHGDQSRFMKEGSGPDHFEQYIQFVKASGGEAVFTANILNGTVAELDEFLSRLQAERIPIAAVVLGVEMHLGQAQALGLNGYLERIKPYIPMLQTKYPQVPIVAHSTPVGRVGDRAQASFHEWNQALARLPGIDGFSQYGWPEFGTDVRRLMASAAEQTPGERWRQYDEFARTFPDRQLAAYQRDWGGDKKMYMLQWGTHLDRNTPVQGLHMANFYFFLAQYNAAHNDYFAVATSAPILAENVSKGARRGGVIYKDKIALFASYLYTKPFRHLFSGDKKLLAASIAAADKDAKAGTVKALAAAGADGRKYLYVINSGPAVPLGKVAVDGTPLLADLRVQVESVWGDPASASVDGAARGTSAPAKTFMGERSLNGVMLEPFSLTLLITPNDAQQKAAPPAKDAANPAFAPVKDDPALPRVLLIGDSISMGYTMPVRRALAGKANVHRPAANCGPTTRGLETLGQWLGDGHWDVIHFNWGLHDLQQTPLDQYQKNLRELVARLKKTGAVLVWCSSTPVPTMGPGRKNNEDVKAYNAAAKKIMEQNGIRIDDLFAFALPRIKDLQIPANVHFTAQGSRVLAEQVTASILAALCSATPLGKTEVGNQALRVQIDPQARGAIVGILDQSSGRNFVVAEPAVPLYTITLADDQHRRTTAGSSQAISVTPRLAADGRSVQLVFTHDQPKLIVHVQARLPAEGSLSYWRLDVENKTPLAIVRVDFPGFAVPQVLGSDPDDTALIFPNANNDQRYWNLPEEFQYSFAQRTEGKGSLRWPLKLCQSYCPDAVQMMAYYDRTAGLYLATHDGSSHVKELSVEGLSPATMRLNVGHVRPWLFGKDFTMDYDTVLGVFHGDWTAAAEIYRGWAMQQRWCAKGTLSTKDTPAWIKRYPVHLRFMLDHPKLRQLQQASPRQVLTKWSELLPTLEQFHQDYPDLYPDAMVNLINHDVGGTWSGFYNERWPAWMGDEAFAEGIRQIKQRGLHASIEPFGWHINVTDDRRPDYDLRQKPFYADLYEQTLVWPERPRQAQRGVSACVASAYGQSVFLDDAKQTAPWGMDLLQVMEINLADRMNCFNPHHGHPPGHGPWVFEAALEAARKVREAGRAVNPDFGTDKEETAELLIPVLDCMYIRNAQVKNMRWNGRPQFYKNNVPLFDFVYHPYVALIDGFEAKDPLTARWCAGIAVALGHLTGPLFDGNPRHRLYQDASQGGAFELVRQGKKAYNSYARQHVVFGRVLPPPNVAFPEMRQPAQHVFVFQQCAWPRGNDATRAEFVTPKVLQSAHLAPEGSVGLTFVNVSDDEVRFDLNPSRYARYLEHPMAKLRVRHNGEVVTQQQVDLRVADASVTLAIKPLALLFVTLE